MADVAPEQRENKESQLVKNSKKRGRNPEEWYKQKQKRLRIAGKAHRSANGKVVPEKQPGEDCKCRRKCFERIPESVRLKTFEGFYSMKSHDEQNAYLFGLMRQIDIKRKRRKDSSRRSCTFEYFVRVRGRETQVCQAAFRSIHAITERKVRVLCKKMDDGIMFPNDNRGKNNAGRAGIVRLPQDIINQIKSHICAIVHTHRLKDFLRIDKVTGLEINISKMWKDYIKMYDPTYVFATFTKSKKKASTKDTTPTVIPSDSVVSPSNTNDYCSTYSTTGGIVGLANNYIGQTVVPAQYPAMSNYLMPDKMTYFPQSQVVVQANNVQQLIQASEPVQATLTESHSSQQTFASGQPGSRRAFLIVRTLKPPTVKPEQSLETEGNLESKNLAKKGPAVKQWRYTSVFHEEINGLTLAAIKTRIPQYFSEKKKSSLTKNQKNIQTQLRSQHEEIQHPHQQEILQLCQQQQQQCQPISYQHQACQSQQPCTQQVCQSQECTTQILSSIESVKSSLF